MGREIDCVKTRQGDKKNISVPSPSCRELAARFMELQLLRQKVKAAESRQSPAEQPPAPRR
jgi:hypothetical protein